MSSNATRKLEPTECPICHHVFTPTSPNQKTCLGECQRKAYNAKKVAWERSNKDHGIINLTFADIKKLYLGLSDDGKSKVRNYFFTLYGEQPEQQRKIVRMIGRLSNTMPGVSVMKALEVVGQLGVWTYQNRGGL